MHGQQNIKFIHYKFPHIPVRDLQSMTCMRCVFLGVWSDCEITVDSEISKSHFCTAQCYWNQTNPFLELFKFCKILRWDGNSTALFRPIPHNIRLVRGITGVPNFGLLIHWFLLLLEWQMT